MATNLLTSVAVEALVAPPVNGRVSLVVTEALMLPAAKARVSQVFVEVLRSVDSVPSANRRRCMMIS